MIVLYALLPQKTFAVLASEQNTDKQRDAGDQINPEQPFLCGRFENKLLCFFIKTSNGLILPYLPLERKKKL